MRNVKLRAILIAAVAALSAAVIWLYAGSWAPARAAFPTQGIDLSEAHGEVHWPSAAAAGVDFAYLRATHGAAGRDTRFAGHWAASRDAGVKRGAYHAYSLCHPAEAQADNFVAAVPRERDELRPALMLMFEDECTARPARDPVIKEIRALVKAIEQQTGKPVLLMLDEDFENHYRVSEAIKRDLWLENAFFEPAFGERRWLIWRASTVRRVEGIDQPVNWSVLYPA